MLAFGVMSVLLSIMIIGVSLLVIGLVLLQKNRGSGLSGAFGGVGGHSAFGTKTGDFLTWITVGLVGLFLLLNVVANYAFEPEKLDRTKNPATPAADTTSETIPPISGEAPASGTPTPVSTTPVPVSTTPSPAPATTPPAEQPAAPAATPPAGESAPAGGTPPTSN